MPGERIIAVGLLTEQDLDVLGRQFTRFFPVSSDNVFADLLRQLDLIEATPPDRCTAHPLQHLRADA